jgi:tellurite resistance protein
MESLTIARIWAAAAWADGVLHPREADALRRFIDASTELDPESRAAAFALLNARPAIELAEVQRLSSDARQGILRAALGIVRLDGKVTPDEEEWLARLRTQLGLDAATQTKIDGETT